MFLAPGPDSVRGSRLRCRPVSRLTTGNVKRSVRRPRDHPPVYGSPVLHRSERFGPLGCSVSYHRMSTRKGSSGDKKAPLSSYEPAEPIMPPGDFPISGKQFNWIIVDYCAVRGFSDFLFRRFGHFEPVEPLTAAEIGSAVEIALAEDIGSGDVTTLTTVPAEAKASARMAAREALVVAGLALAETAFRQLCLEVEVARKTKDGQQVAPGSALLSISGPARALLSAERVALKFVQAIQGTRAQILDTRKTTPGWRRLEKYAVTCGGGHNHRIGLYDMVLIKDNHLAVLSRDVPDPISTAVQRARSKYPKLKIEVEADTLEQ